MGLVTGVAEEARRTQYGVEGLRGPGQERYGYALVCRVCCVQDQARRISGSLYSELLSMD